MWGMDPTAAASGAAEFERPQPKRIARMAQRMQAVTGQVPAVTHPTPNRTRLTCTSPRVEVWVEFKGQSGSWAKTQLAVDGVPREPLHSDIDLKQLWDDPDGNGGLAPGELPPIPETSRALPPEVQRFLKQLPDAGFEAGFDQDAGRWLLGFDVPGGGLRVFFTRYRGRWDVSVDRPLMVVADGKDVSAQANGKIDQAMALLMKPSPTAPGVSQPPVAGSADSTRSNSVETRRRVVIRE